MDMIFSFKAGGFQSAGSSFAREQNLLATRTSLTPTLSRRERGQNITRAEIPSD
jgi:hypothetical protein